MSKAKNILNEAEVDYTEYTVGQLIAELQSLPPETGVFINSDDVVFSLNGIDLEQTIGGRKIALLFPRENYGVEIDD